MTETQGKVLNLINIQENEKKAKDTTKYPQDWQKKLINRKMQIKTTRSHQKSTRLAKTLTFGTTKCYWDVYVAIGSLKLCGGCVNECNHSGKHYFNI